MTTKVYTFLICCLVINFIYGQGKPTLQIQAGINLSEFGLNADFVDPIFMERIPERVHLGYSFAVLGELPISPRQSFIYGLASTQLNNFPKVDYGLWYGMSIEKDGDYLYLNPSYLERLRFDLIELPLCWRYYLAPNTKIKPYLGVGVTTSFSWRERERWKSMVEPESFIVDTGSGNQIFEYEETQNDFRHFRTAFTFKLGSLFQLGNHCSLIVDLQTNLLEHRRTRKSMIVDWLPEYWGAEQVYLSQMSMHVGLQRNF